ncbi:MAG: hypothetical protein FJX76_00290 [Armatimonadetes bacterium]|nr:hypothetical protein [Armatimonadota bacterium]
MLTISYHVENGVLLRAVTTAQGTARSDAVAEGVAGFSCAAQGKGLYQIDASFQDGKIVKTLSTRLRLRIGQ